MFLSDINYEADKRELCKECKCFNECLLTGNEIINCELRKILEGKI